MKVVRIKEAAKYLNISVSMLYLLLKRGKLPYVKIGKSTRFVVDDLDRWLRKNTLNKMR